MLSRTSRSSSTTAIRAPASGVAAGACSACAASASARRGEREPERRATARKGGERDRVAEEIAQSPHDRQPQAQPLVPVPVRALDLVELLEDAGPVLLRDADAGVAHLQDDAARAAARADQHPAGIGVADGVGHEVAQDALEEHRVGAHDDAGGDEAQREPLLLGRRGEVVGEAVEERLQRHGPRARIDRARVQPRDVEHLAEQRLQRADGAGDAAGELAALVVAGALGQRRGEESERVQRLAQVVARGGEEARLGEVGAVGLAARLRLARGLDLQRARLLGHAPLELEVELLVLREREREAVDHDPAHEAEEGEGHVGHEVHRAQVPRVLRREPVAHADGSRHAGRREEQRAHRVARAPGVVHDGVEGEGGRGERAQAHGGRRGEEDAGRGGGIEHGGARGGEHEHHALVSRPAGAREAHAEDAEQHHPQHVDGVPPDGEVRRRQWRARQQRHGGVQAPQDRGRREHEVLDVVADAHPQDQDEDAQRQQREARHRRARSYGRTGRRGSRG